MLFNFLGVSAQDFLSSKPLMEVLKEIQVRFGYQFNYASEFVDDITIKPPSRELSFNESLQYLKGHTGLIFNILDNKIISVKRPEIQFCGYLKDKGTQEPIANATVQGNKKSTITDENGYFELKSSSENEIIKMRHIGFKTLEWGHSFFKSDTCVTIYLMPQQQVLTEIVLYDYLIRGIDKLNNGSFKIDFEKFSILPGLVENDVLQSVQAFPGILSTNETVSNINIRGGSNDQNLILWDEIKMYQSGHFFGLISMYNSQITQNVTLRKNGTPVSRTDGVSGTIAMETEKNINEQFKGNIGINLIDANGFVDVPIGKKASVQVAARKSISDFFETPTYSEFFRRISQDTELETNTLAVINSDISFDFYDTSFRLLYQPSEKDKLQLNFITANNEIVFNENAILNETEESRESSVTQNSIAEGLRYERIWNERFSTVFNIYETDYILKAINANILDDQRFLQENKVSESGIRIVANYDIEERLQWIGGYQYVDTKVTNLDDVDDPIFRRLDGEVLRTHGVFNQLGYKSGNRMTTINLGLRYNYLDQLGKQLWEPRLSFNQRFLQWFNLEVLGEFKHQSTSQVIHFQNDFLGIEKRRWQLSNNDTINAIPVIESKQVSLGLSYGRRGWLVNAVGFYKGVDGITTQSQGFQDRYEFVKKSGSYTASGIDVLLRKKFKSANGWLSYSFLDSQYTFQELSENTFPSNFDITHAFSLGTTYSLEHFHFATGLNWRTGKPFTRPVVNNEVVDGEVNFARANNHRIQEYIRVDLSALYQFSLGRNCRAKIGLSIWNLLDKENTINNFFRANTLEQAEEVEQYSLGITPNAVFRVYF